MVSRHIVSGNYCSRNLYCCEQYLLTLFLFHSFMANEFVTECEFKGSWYVVFSKPRQEAIAARNLENQGYETWLPMLSRWQCSKGVWAQTDCVMFPRYLFVRAGRPEQGLGPIRSTLGVTDLVRFGNTLAIVSDLVIAEIRRIEEAERLRPDLRLSPFFPGESVNVVNGPLKGLQGVVQRSALMRVSVLVSLLGRDNEVSISPDWLRKTG